MYRRSTAPPGAGRYSIPSSSRPSDPTVGASSSATWLALSVITPPGEAKRGPWAPLSDDAGFRRGHPVDRVADGPGARKTKKAPMEPSSPRESVVAGAGYATYLTGPLLIPLSSGRE